MDPKDASYTPFPEHSVYSEGNRYDLVKEDHKTLIAGLEAIYDKEAEFSLVDVGCGNGEFLNNVKKVFPNAKLTGYDFAPEFIEVGKAYTGLDGVELICLDIFAIDKTYDVVVCDGVLQIYPDCEKFLQKMLDICNKDGMLLLFGLFNPYDIDVCLQYRDYTFEKYKDLWREDYCMHSQKRVATFLDDKVSTFRFDKAEMNVHLEIRPEDPMRTWTFKDEDGNTIITNGANVILQKHLLTIKR